MVAVSVIPSPLPLILQRLAKLTARQGGCTNSSSSSRAKISFPPHFLNGIIRLSTVARIAFSVSPKNSAAPETVSVLLFDSFNFLL